MLIRPSFLGLSFQSITTVDADFLEVGARYTISVASGSWFTGFDRRTIGRTTYAFTALGSGEHRINKLGAPSPPAPSPP